MERGKGEPRLISTPFFIAGTALDITFRPLVSTILSRNLMDKVTKNRTILVGLLPGLNDWCALAYRKACKIAVDPFVSVAITH